jgi:hypothetical protein
MISKVIWTSPNLGSAFTWRTYLSNVSCKKKRLKEINIIGMPKILILFKRQQKSIRREKPKGKSKDD